MKKYLFLLLIATTFYCCSSEKHFISDKVYREKVENDFNARKAEFTKGGVFDIFNTPMTLEEREAMQFLYAYMPISDYVDNAPTLMLDAVRSAFKTRNEVAWGNTIPEEIFRHFVLPIRANNEYLDSSRNVFYGELIDRVKNLSIEEAALEVNHWCHEKVTYRPSDSRTSSPLESVKTAHGRCGEESVFAVAALRSVGIPARQVYTPRWAHTDDNHAWIEVWTPDGTWKYMGACEPEPRLNMAWFSEPVQRGMLMHTKAYGDYKGDEEFISSTSCFTEVNSTQNYAPIANAKVIVKNEAGEVVEGAKVFFGIYNYSEFYPCVRRESASDGSASAVTGRGDLYVYAWKDNLFGHSKIAVGKEESVDIILSKRVGDIFSQEMDIIPPTGGTNTIQATDEEIAINNKRLDEENKIRGDYEGTFITANLAREYGAKFGVDEEKMAHYLCESRGNWQTILTLFEVIPAERRELAMALLSALQLKDLRDVTLDVLLDNINSGDTSKVNDRIYVENVLNPRVKMERLKPYKAHFVQNLPQELKEHIATNPMAIRDWVNSYVTLNNEANPYYLAVSPYGVMLCGVADNSSRDIFFVAVARSLNIPARVDYLTGKVQYYNGVSWVDVKFNNTKEAVKAKTGTLKIDYTKAAGVDDPLYDRHFTIKRFQNGEFKLLNFRSSDGTEGTTSMIHLFSKGHELEEGYYLLTMGTRMASGKTLVSMQTFNVKEGETTTIKATMREDKEDIQVIGAMNPEEMFLKEGDSEEGSILNTTGRGYFVLGVIKARHEPTTHTIRDFVRGAKGFEKWGRKMILLFENENDLKAFNKTEYGELPSNIVFGVDKGGKITNMLLESCKIENKSSRPIFIIADTFGRIVYSTNGYSIGVGEQMLTVINKL